MKVTLKNHHSHPGSGSPVCIMQGGQTESVIDNRVLCAANGRAAARTGQNGKPHNSHPLVEAGCGRRGKRGSHAAP